jgi:hypothetical protein
MVRGYRYFVRESAIVEEVRDLPGVHFVQDLCILWIVVAHQFAAFDAESVSPECEVSDHCFLDCSRLASSIHSLQCANLLRLNQG